MDRLLRSKEQSEVDEGIKDINKLFEKTFDFNSNFMFFPVRHHSPACSFHIIKTIEKYKPEAILIEGPRNASELIEFAVSDKTKAPFCIYLSYDDKKGKINENCEKYRAYYPFLDYSPELVSLREGNRLGIHCEFIDLFYGEKLMNTPKLTKLDIEEYSDDRTFTQSNYYKILTEKLGCKNFNELWEMLFEIEGCHMDTLSFVKNLFFYCYYSRKNTSDEELLYHGDIIREYYMAENIRNAIKNYKKVLIVTGGIHTIELINLITAEKIPEYKIEHIKKEDSPSYLMPYSFEESDKNYGYEAGMVFPFFYQKVWENINKNVDKPFEETVLRFIINTANLVRKKQPLSITDEMQSYYMARGLSELRGKKECGAFEAIDAVKSSFVKGEINSQHQPALKNLYKLMTGMEMGSVDTNAGVPPIVNDFLEQCRKFKIQTNTSLKKETKLDIYNNEQHREKSQFLHQMKFLNTQFCTYLKGQDSNTTSNRILLRETWEYRFSPSVQVALICNSAYGGTLKQACLSLISKELINQHSNASIMSQNLLEANRMGIDEIYEALIKSLVDIISKDMDFLSVSNCFKNLCNVKSYLEMFKNKEIKYLDNILNLSINRIFTLIYTVIQVKKENEDKVCQSIKFLYNYFIENIENENNEEFIDNMFSIYNDLSANGALSGISSGILLKKDKILLEDTIEKFNSYLKGSENAKKMSASFLKGFFMIAKDSVFIDDRLINSLDCILKETDGDLFYEILPDLRLAFTYFLPFETDIIAEKVSKLYNVTQEAVLYEKTLNLKEMDYASKIDEFCKSKLKEWLLPAEME